MTPHPNRRRATKARPVSSTNHKHEIDYSALLAGVASSFNRIAATNAKLFLTNAEHMSGIYLDALPNHRQVHNCHCCRKFIGMYGGVVSISDNGDLIPVMWAPENVPEFYHEAFSKLFNFVRRSRIKSIFLTNQSVWGMPVTGKWSHLAIVPPAKYVYRERALTASQAMAASKENYRTVLTTLKEFSIPMLDEALRILNAGALARSEKFVGPVQWLRDLQNRPKGRVGENILWRAIGGAPEGYCHPRASVIGSLLEDIATGVSFNEVKTRFDAKMGPLLYQRPQAPPSLGNVKAAEALVEKLGIGPSLERRFARLDELKTIWTPSETARPQSAGGVFGHLKTKNDPTHIPLDMPAVTMTWDKFWHTIMPTVTRLELFVPLNGRFIALTTATNANAPAIMKWDRDDDRNPVAWYVYPNGSPARQWGLTGGTWAKITGITPFPNEWSDKNAMKFLSEGVVLVIDGALDIREDCGNAIFPECLRDDLRGIRPTIEAYSRSAVVSGRENASACGYDIRKSSADCRLRAFSNGAWTDYRVDRWD